MLSQAIPFEPERQRGLLTTRWFGRRLIHLAHTASTNDAAWEALAAGAPAGTIVIADVQDAGRGRAGRSWYMAAGRGLALSVLVELPRSPGLLPLAAGVALARACAALGLETELKWPNDVLAGGRKLAGILCESRATGIGSVGVVGVGVNVTDPPGSFPSELASRVTSFAIEGISVGREEVAAAFANAFEPLCNALAAGEDARVTGAWIEHAAPWGRRVRIRGADSFVATTVALDPSGALVVRLASGALRRVHAGDVEPDPPAASRPPAATGPAR